MKAHFETTGPEIWRDTEGKVDIFVSAVGSGGTVSGTGAYLKSQNKDIKVVAVEAAASLFYQVANQEHTKSRVFQQALFLASITVMWLTKSSVLKMKML